MSDDQSASQSAEQQEKVPKRSFLKRCLILTLEAIALVLGIGVLSLFLFIFMLSRGPIGADFLIPHIEKTLNNVQGRMSVSMEAVQLEWLDDESEIALNIFNLDLRNQMGSFMSIRQAKVKISVASLLSGEMSFDKASMIGVTVQVDRHKDGSFHIFNQDQTQYGPPARSTALSLDKIIDNLPPIRVLTISDSSVTYYDHQTMQRRSLEDVSLRLSRGDDATLSRNVNGFIRFTSPVQDTGESFTLDFLYDDAVKELILSGRLGRSSVPDLIEYLGLAVDVSDLQMKGIDIFFNARGDIRLSNEWQILGMNFSANAAEGTINLPDMSIPPIDLQNIAVILGYNPQSNMINFEKMQARIGDIDVNITGFVDITSNTVPSLRASGNIAIQTLDVDKFDILVPDIFSEEPLYKWMVEKLSVGRFENISIDLATTAELRSIAEQGDLNTENENRPEPISVILVEASNGDLVPVPEFKPSWDMLMATEFEQEDMIRLDEFYGTISDQEMMWVWSEPEIQAAFSFQDLHIDYRPPMMPASDAQGNGLLDGKALTLNVDRASIGKMTVTSGALYFDDLVTKGKGMADIKLAVQTKAIDAFEFLAREPIDFGKHLRFDRQNVKGDATLKVALNFPTVKDVKVEQINIDVEGELTDTVLPGVLKGMSLAGGPFKLTATQNEYRMTGRGRLDGRPITLNWHSYFSKGKGRPYEGRIKAQMNVDDRFLSSLGVDITEYISGAMDIDLDMTEGWSGRSELSLTADVQEARINLPVFEYTTSATNTGTLKTKVILQDEKLQRIEDLSIASQDVTLIDGDLDFVRRRNGDVRLDKASIEKLRFQQNDFGIRLQQTGAGLMKIDVEGQRFDARHFLSKSGDNGEGAADEEDEAFEVGLKANTVITEDTESISNVRAYIKGDQGKLQQLEVDAVIGQGALYVRYKPNMEDRYSLRIEADDAGATFKAFGITDKVTGGKLTVAGIPSVHGYYGDVRGLLRIDNFNVRAAPTLASIVKLMDLPTMMTSLNSQGLDFARLETEFEWLNRKGGGVINVKDGRTSGGSMGLTFDGEINRTLGTIAINGTIVPASTLNSFFSGIPLVGQILSGGSGSIFAATYTMKGSMDDPKTSVNPLSVLAPGIIRRILFEGGD